MLTDEEAKAIVSDICREYGVEPQVLRTTAKTWGIVRVRWACVRRLRWHGLSYPRIARAIGYRHHSSAMHAYYRMATKDW